MFSSRELFGSEAQTQFGTNLDPLLSPKNGLLLLLKLRLWYERRPTLYLLLLRLLIR